MWLPGTCQDKTCFFQTNLLQAHPVLPGEQLPAPPSHRPQPHVASSMGASTGHTPATGPCSPPSSPASLGSRPGSPGTARGCSPTAPTGAQSTGQNRSVQAGPGSVAQHGTAQCGTMPSWSSHWVPASCPAQQVPHLLEPPRPRPAVMGACGGATSTALSCSTLSQGALAAAQTTAPSQRRTGWALLAGSSWIQPPPGSTALGGSPARHSCQGDPSSVPAAGGLCRAGGGCKQAPHLLQFCLA